MASQAAKERGDEFYRNGQYANAVDAFTNAISLATRGDPDLATIHSNRCACYLQLNKNNLALEDAFACVNLKPDWAKGYSRLGSCFVRLGRGAEAVVQFQKAANLDPYNAEIHKALSHARNMSSNSSSSAPQNPQGMPGFQGFTGFGGMPGFGGFGTGAQQLSGTVDSVKRFLETLISRAAVVWASMKDESKLVALGGLCLVVYYLFFSGGYSGYNYYEPDYSYSYGRYGYGNRGMSWTMWLSILAGAYYIPPMFPDALGQYSRPFFGMNWTTFIWLLNMFSRGGGMGMPLGGGMFGRRRRF